MEEYSDSEADVPPTYDSIESLKEMAKSDEISLIDSASLGPTHELQIHYPDEVDNILNFAIDDAILEVLDARDPVGARCEDIAKMVMQSGPDKHLILLLNKIDLVPRETVDKWLKYLRENLPTIAFKCSTQVLKCQIQWAVKQPTILTSVAAGGRRKRVRVCPLREGSFQEVSSSP